MLVLMKFASINGNLLSSGVKAVPMGRQPGSGWQKTGFRKKLITTGSGESVKKSTAN